MGVNAASLAKFIGKSDRMHDAGPGVGPASGSHRTRAARSWNAAWLHLHRTGPEAWANEAGTKIAFREARARRSDGTAALSG